MGYTTRFAGAVNLSRKLTFKEAKFFLDAWEDRNRADIWGADHPDSYLKWVPTCDLQHIVWDGNEKFYHYLEWLRWMMSVLEAWGVSANGTLRWSGESVEDVGTITITQNVVSSTTSTTEASDNLEPLTHQSLSRLILAEIE